jgi:hypothetical protein
MKTPFTFACLVLAAACGSDDATGVDPSKAPVASVDRFSDSFGKLFKRTAPIFDPANVMPIVPAPNAPIDFDALFTVRALGPTGTPTMYYSFDILPRQPAKAWVMMRDGRAIEGQLPIIAGLPGDAGYNDFVRITEVSVGKDYVANQFVSVEDVDAAVAAGEATAVETTRIANWATVPAGSTAVKKFAGQVVTGQRSWFNGQVVHQMRFEENLTVKANGQVPTAEIIVIFENNMSPAAGFAKDASGMTHNAIDTLAGGPTYSSLWNHSVGNKANFNTVVDYPSALANVMAANVGVDVNCPEVR